MSHQAIVGRPTDFWAMTQSLDGALLFAVLRVAHAFLPAHRAVVASTCASR